MKTTPKFVTVSVDVENNIATFEDGSSIDAGIDLLSSSVKLAAALKTLSRTIAGVNNRQHAGIGPSPADWSELYQLTSEADALLVEAGVV
jgi:hypothetical protein